MRLCASGMENDFTNKGNIPFIVIDTHCDTPGRLADGAVLSSKGDNGHFDYPRMAEGGVDCEFFALYTPNDMPPDAALRRVMEMSAAVHDSVEAFTGVRMAYSPSDVLRNKEAGRRSVAVGMENAAPLCKSLPLLREMYRMGVRYVTLTHNGNNEICDAALAPEKRWNGLSPFGKEFVSEMNRIGMMIDVSHISDDSFFDVLSCSSAPVIASHSCCRAISEHPRNMTDGMIKALADAGGVVQINFCPLFVDASCDESAYETLPSFKEVADHIEHVIKIAGIGSVGIGSDFDGIDHTPKGLEDISKMPALLQELSGRGYGEKELALIAGGNFLRVWKAVDDKKTLKIDM